jgi:hypothetical protein
MIIKPTDQRKKKPRNTTSTYIRNKSWKQECVLSFNMGWRIMYFGIISLAHALVHVAVFSVMDVSVDELSSAQIWQHK